jgi:hypothetical protein
MKRQFILSFLFIFFSQLSLCQSGSDLIDITTYQEPFIYLKDGTLLLEPDFRVKKRFLFGNSFYDANDKKIRLKDVKYFQHKNGR